MTRASRFHRVSGTWRRYEEVTLPDCLLVTADSVCNFNPVYGHGMTVAALEAEKLGTLLAARQKAAVGGQAAAGSAGGASWLAGVPQEYQRAITPIIQEAWDMSVGEHHGCRCGQCLLRVCFLLKPTTFMGVWVGTLIMQPQLLLAAVFVGNLLKFWECRLSC
jgi:hypothetical protein